ncbi:hypothetical protein JTE90_004709 [Oedothorax gibbosus]|uniref:Epidermal growth factor-like protein 7 n=1 Tax=Oedothorax gibbosus TaxID=931172 RepID=A0AAV6TTP0_9ARAC|nr:hypothetical protein JTE90_004709 [Oedothorax gibbosus]
MKCLYLWIILSWSSLVASNDASRRVDTSQHYNNQKSAAVHKGVAKRGERKVSGDPSRRLHGRHVCTQSKVTMIPMKDVQSYCKPVYQSYLRRCDQDNSRYCSGYRVAYEVGYRPVQRMVAKTESTYSCCPGWTQVRSSSADCKRAICVEQCQNGGSCSKPNHCACAPGWTGKTCTTDVDECTTGKSACDHDCTNTQGSYKCSCRGGYVLQPDGRTCEKKEPRVEKEYDAGISKKMEDLQKRLDALEEWQRSLSDDKADSRHQRDDRINSLSEQIALLEERLEEYRKTEKEKLRRKHNDD